MSRMNDNDMEVESSRGGGPIVAYSNRPIPSTSAQCTLVADEFRQRATLLQQEEEKAAENMRKMQQQHNMAVMASMYGPQSGSGVMMMPGAPTMSQYNGMYGVQPQGVAPPYATFGQQHQQQQAMMGMAPGMMHQSGGFMHANGAAGMGAGRMGMGMSMAPYTPPYGGGIGA